MGNSLNKRCFLLNSNNSKSGDFELKMGFLRIINFFVKIKHFFIDFSDNRCYLCIVMINNNYKQGDKNDWWINSNSINGFLYTCISKIGV